MDEEQSNSDADRQSRQNGMPVSVEHPLRSGEGFEGQEFAPLEWPKAELSRREFVRCRFTKMVLAESNWSGARLDDCVFDGCDLSRARFAQLALRGVSFSNCRITGVDWSDIRPTPTVSFDGCNLQYSSFVKVNLTGTAFLRCRLSDAQFLEVRLVGADFSGSDLTGCRIEDCDARKANFAEARGLFIDPVRNRLKDARIALDAAVLLAESFGLKVEGYS